MIWIFCVLFVAVAVQGQLHEGPGIKCYSCGGAHHPLPECLSQGLHNCHHEELCQIIYGGHKTEIRCRRKHDCDRASHEATRQCASGGDFVHDSCQVCCSDDACVDNMVQTISSSSATAVNHLAVHCPISCMLDDLASCISSGHVCNSQQFCYVTQDVSSNRMHGHCEPLDELQHCQEQTQSGHCDPRHHQCVMGCCTNDSCVASSLGAPTSNLYELLKGDCVDQIPASQCAALDTAEHLCNERLALRVCPKTCGLCSAFHLSDCQDTVQNEGCKALMLSEDICSSRLAMHICPVTCNMCDAILMEKIKDALQNNQQTTTAQPVHTSRPPTASPITCSDLVDQNCVIINALCANNVDCPDLCSRCSDVGTDSPKPVDTTPTPAVVTSADPVVTSADPVVTSADPVVTSADPVVTDVDPVVTSADPPASANTLGPAAAANSTSAADAAAAATGAPAHSTSPAPGHTLSPSADTASPACQDTIKDMNCDDLQDVCSSPLLANYCQKFCNLC